MSNNNLNSLFVVILLVQVFIVTTLFVSYLLIAMGNNYMLIPIQEQGLKTYADNPTIYNAFEMVGDNYEKIGWGWIDKVIIMVLLIFFSTSVILAYRIKHIGYMTWASLMYYGNMVLLFLLQLIEGFTDWFYDLMVAVIPSISYSLPFTMLYLDNVGIFTLLQICILLTANIFDLELRNLFVRKKQEQQVLEDDEIL